MNSGVAKYFLSFIVAFALCGILGFQLYAQVGSVNNRVSTELNAQGQERWRLFKEVFTTYRFSNPDTTYLVLDGGLKYYRDNDDISREADILCLLAKLDADRGNFNLARNKLTQSMMIYDKLQNVRGGALVSNLLGTLDGRTGNFDKAAGHFLEALKKFQALSDSLGMLNAYMNLGNISRSMKEIDKSMDYNMKAMSMFNKDIDVRTKCNLYNNIGITFGLKGDLKSAVIYLQKALDGSDKQNYIDIYLYSLLNFGIVYQQFNDLPKALSYFEEALGIAREKKMPEEEARLLQNIGGVYNKTDLNEALKKLNEALEISKRIEHKGLIDEIYQELIVVHKKLGNYKEMVTLMEQERALSDSLINIDKAKQIASLEAVYELEQTNNNLKQLKLKELANLNKRNALLAVVVSLALIVLVVLVFYRKTRMLNNELEKQREALATSNAMKDNLFSVIGHDLRGPVGNINMVLDILDDDQTTPEERNFLMQALRGQSQTTLETLETLLYWGKSQINKTGVNPIKLNVTDSVQKNRKLLNFSATAKNIRITNQIPGDVIVYADADHVDFVLRNLLSNAIKYTANGGSVTLSADKEKLSGFVVISVKDTGVGMSKEQLQEVFKPIIKSAPGTENEKGTGIGLMLCYEFVVQNGGKLWVESELGKGATFYVAFKSA
jgi:signal transduction histidine kinase